MTKSQKNLRNFTLAGALALSVAAHQRHRLPGDLGPRP